MAGEIGSWVSTTFLQLGLKPLLQFFLWFGGDQGKTLAFYFSSWSYFSELFTESTSLSYEAEADIEELAEKSLMPTDPETDADADVLRCSNFFLKDLEEQIVFVYEDADVKDCCK